MSPILFLDGSFDWSPLTSNGPIVSIFFACLMAGYRRVWLFRSQHEEVIGLYAQQLVLKDNEIARVNEERERERQRADRYEERTIRLLETAREVTHLATEVVTKRGGHSGGE